MLQHVVAADGAVRICAGSSDKAGCRGDRLPGVHLAAEAQLSGSDRCRVRSRFWRDFGWKAEGLVQINPRRAASAVGLRLPARAGRDGKEERVGELPSAHAPHTRGDATWEPTDP